MQAIFLLLPFFTESYATTSPDPASSVLERIAAAMLQRLVPDLSDTALSHPAFSLWLLLFALPFFMLAYFIWEQWLLKKHCEKHQLSRSDYYPFIAQLIRRTRFKAAGIILLSAALSATLIFSDITSLRSAKNTAAIKESLTEMEESLATCADQPKQLACPQPTLPPAPQEAQDRMDKIKQDYEQAFITLLVLQHCGMAPASDGVILSYALLQAATGMPDPHSIEKGIVSTAQGTYAELYADTDCSSPSLAASLESHKSFLATVQQLYSQQIMQSTN